MLILQLQMAVAERRTAFDNDWLFHRGDSLSSHCDSNSFPIDLNGTRCLGLKHQPAATSIDACRTACCSVGISCQTFQWCTPGKPCDRESHTRGCWIGAMDNCDSHPGMSVCIVGARDPLCDEGRGDCPLTTIFFSCK